MSKKISAVLAVVIFFGLTIYSINVIRQPSSSTHKLKVLSYSSFVAEWGPAKELGQAFQKKYDVEVEYQDAEDSGLLLSKLDLFPSDVVLGLDWISAEQARQTHKWKQSSLSQDHLFSDANFVAFDWSPLTFIYREGELVPPRNLDDLLDPRFKNAISLEDPRTSGPGLQFLFWIIAEKGEAGAFEFLEKLKPNIRAVSPSWSTAYGLFQKKQSKLVFSYLTSPVYHWIKEGDFKYKPAALETNLIYQVEYAGVPNDCKECEAAAHYLEFLLSDEAQKIIMKKNIMLPIVADLVEGTEFARLPKVKLVELAKLKALAARKNELLEKWKALKL